MSNYSALIKDTATRYGLDPELAMRVARQESGFNPRATSRAGAQGLFQLMPGTAKDLGVTDAYDPVQNVDAGIRYLKQQMDRYQDPRLALAAYNAGPGNVDKAGRQVPNIAETQDYVYKIWDSWKDPNAPKPSRTEARVQNQQVVAPTGEDARGGDYSELKAMYQAQLDNSNKMLGLAQKQYEDSLTSGRQQQEALGSRPTGGYLDRLGAEMLGSAVSRFAG
jgi:hypothetical protein